MNSKASFKATLACLGAVGLSVFMSAPNAQTAYQVTEVTFNGGGAGEAINFDQETSVSITETTGSLDISITGTTIRVKCAGQTSPAECVLYADGGGASPPTDPQPADADGDGVPDDSDLCPGTAAGAAVNADGCSADQIGSTGSYCENVNTTLVSCDPAVNHDSLYADSTEYALDEPSGQKLLAVPFTTKASTSARGVIRYTSSESISGYAWRMWFSTVPGGAPLSGSACDFTDYPRWPLEWTQDSNGSGCFLGNEARTLYLNYQTICTSGSNCYYPQVFDFFAARQLITP